MSDAVTDQPDVEVGDADDTAPIRAIRDQLKAERRARKDAERQVEELRSQVDLAGAAIRGPALEYLGTQAGLTAARAKALARLHDGPVDDGSVVETIERFGLDKPVGRAEADDE
jgi:hypothetical protein